MPEAGEKTELGVRGRQKQQTRKRLQGAAKDLFERKGYDDVTVAEIAAAADVSVKTLFQYFHAKEDLLLAELDQTHADMIRWLRDRDAGQTPLQAVSDWLFDWEERGPPDGFERFMRMVGTGPAVQSMRRRLYEEWEGELVAVLADEANEARPNPRTRLIAAQLIAMIRVLTSPEVSAALERHPVDERHDVFMALTHEAVDLLANGIDPTD